MQSIWISIHDIWVSIYDPECGLATQILGHYLVRLWPAGDGSHKSRWPNIWHVHARLQFIHWQCAGLCITRRTHVYIYDGTLCKIFDNKNCQRAPPAHVLTSPAVTPLVPKIGTFVEWNRKANTPNLDEQISSFLIWLKKPHRLFWEVSRVCFVSGDRSWVSAAPQISRINLRLPLTHCHTRHLSYSSG